MESIADCVKKNCYQSASLNILSRSLSEKLALVKRNMLERQRVVKSAFEFHSNYDKVFEMFKTLICVHNFFSFILQWSIVRHSLAHGSTVKV